MIAHLVLFRPRPTLTPDEGARLKDAISRALREIPSIRRALVGRRVTQGRSYEALMRVDYSHAAILEFDDLSGLRAYLEHPAHGQLATHFFDAFEEALMYDYELMEGVSGVEGLTAADR